eukprot:7118360-Prymnesium_polylepis.1
MVTRLRTMMGSARARRTAAGRRRFLRTSAAKVPAGGGRGAAGFAWAHRRARRLASSRKSGSTVCTSTGWRCLPPGAAGRTGCRRPSGGTRCAAARARCDGDAV